MKVRFYCDVPPNYHPQSNNPIFLSAGTMTPTWVRAKGFTRIAFDVDLPPECIVTLYDKQAPATKAMVIESEAQDETSIS